MRKILASTAIVALVAVASVAVAQPAIIAAEVKKGGETLRLRDEAGVPAWSGWRRG